MSAQPAPDAGQPPPRNIWELTASAHRSMLLGGLVAFVGSALKIVPYVGLVEIARGLLSGAPAARLWGWVIAAVIVMMARIEGMRLAIVIMPVWLAAIYVAYRVRGAK